jgi:hypothetical protein
MVFAYSAQDCLDRCVNLQLRAQRWGKEFGIGELMRMAVLEEPNRETVIALCRMLFVSKTTEPLRPPALGEPWFLADTTQDNWPLEPIALYHGIPIFVVNGWSLAGLPEQASWYLAYCLISGVWNEVPYRMLEQEALAVGVHELIARGPWRRPLGEGEKAFLQNQLEATHPSQQSCDK